MIFSKNIKNIKKFLKPGYLFEMTARFFERYSRVFIFLIAIALGGFCIQLWHKTIYRSQWDENQKQTYIKSKGQGITFNEKGFEYDVAAAASRAEESKKELGALTDIFRLKKAAAPAETPTAAVNEDPAVPPPTSL